MDGRIVRKSGAGCPDTRAGRRTSEQARMRASTPALAHAQASASVETGGRAHARGQARTRASTPAHAHAQASASVEAGAHSRGRAGRRTQAHSRADARSGARSLEGA
ncbi:hypothetical protein GCM10009805_09450 [Leucobacter chromiireducens subsp. solipictus]